MNATTDETRHDDGQPATQPEPTSAGPAPGHAASPEKDRARPPETPRSGGGGMGIWTLLVVLLAAVTVGVLLWQRSGEHKKLDHRTQALAEQHVTVTHPAEGHPDNEIVLPGNMVAFNEASIYARTNGYLKSWSTDIGTRVKEGQVMAEIEAPDVDAQLRQFGAALAQAKANLEIANLNFARQQDLLQKKVNSQQEFDQARTNMDAQKAAVQAAEAAVQNLKVQQNFQNILAPFDGVVTRRSTDVGALISASSGGQELFRVARTDTLRVNVYVPQAYAAFVQEGSSAYLVLEEFAGERIQGKVAHIAGAIDPATRTLQTEIQVDNKNSRLFPGAFANVHLQLPLKEAPTVIPVNTLIFRSEGSQVAVVDAQGVVHLKKVTIGHDYGTTLQITNGVTRADRIIVNPSDSLTDGTKVSVQEATPEQAKKAL